MDVAFLIGGWGIFNLGVWLFQVFNFGKLAATYVHGCVSGRREKH